MTVCMSPAKIQELDHPIFEAHMTSICSTFTGVSSCYPLIGKLPSHSLPGCSFPCEGLCWIFHEWSVDSLWVHGTFLDYKTEFATSSLQNKALCLHRTTYGRHSMMMKNVLFSRPYHASSSCSYPPLYEAPTQEIDSSVLASDRRRHLFQHTLSIWSAPSAAPLSSPLLFVSETLDSAAVNLSSAHSACSLLPGKFYAKSVVSRKQLTSC